MALLPDARDRHAPRPDEPRHGDRRRGRATARARRSSNRSPTGCQRPDGRALPAARRASARRQAQHDGALALITGVRAVGGDAGRPAARGRGRREVGTRPVAAHRWSTRDGLVALPGLVDLHTHLREPGREDAETVETGSRAAALGGYTAVHAMANTEPVADTAGVVEQVWRLGREAGLVDVQPVGAVTVGLRRRAARRARRDGRLRGPGAGVLRRRQAACTTRC